MTYVSLEDRGKKILDDHFCQKRREKKNLTLLSVLSYDLSMSNIKSQKDNLHYNLIFHPEPEGGFTVTVPALPGCVTYGKNLVEAKKMAADAIEGYLVSLEKHNEYIPSEQESFITSIRIERPRQKKKTAIRV